MFSLAAQGVFAIVSLYGPFLSTEAAALPRIQPQDSSPLGADVNLGTTHYADYSKIVVTHDGSRPSLGFIDTRKREESEVTKVSPFG